MCIGHFHATDIICVSIRWSFLNDVVFVRVLHLINFKMRIFLLMTNEDVTNLSSTSLILSSCGFYLVSLCLSIVLFRLPPLIDLVAGWGAVSVVLCWEVNQRPRCIYRCSVSTFEYFRSSVIWDAFKSICESFGSWFYRRHQPALATKSWRSRSEDATLDLVILY